MTDLVHRRDTCRLCDSKDLELVVKLTPTPIGAAYVTADRLGEPQECYPVDLFLCRKCGHAQLLDVINPETLFGEAVEVTSVSLGLVDHLEALTNRIIERAQPLPGSLVVDIGSNDGTLLKFFQQREMRGLGVEPSRYVAGIANKVGVNTLSRLFTAELAQEIRRDQGRAAIITANRVFANIDDLQDIVEGIRTLLSEDGLFVFETGYLVDMLEHTLVDLIYHEHLSYESVRSLQPFFRDNGMELIDVERIPVKGGSLRGFVQHKGGPRSVSPHVAELIALEERLGVDRSEPFLAFADKIKGTKSELGTLLAELKADGKSIAGYGAAVGSTTLIYYLGISNELSYLVDDDSAKWGLYSPGHHIPVMPSSALSEKQPDYVVILAWRYADPIINKHRAYLDAGGHFILPLPDPKVI